MEDDEQIKCNKDGRRVEGECGGLPKQRFAGEYQHYSDIHRVSRISIKATNDEFFRRVEGRDGALSFGNEPYDARHRDHSAGDDEGGPDEVCDGPLRGKQFITAGSENKVWEKNHDHSGLQDCEKQVPEYK